MAGKTAILTLRILADAKDAQKGLDDTATSAGKFQTGVERAAVPAAAALAGLAAAGISAAKAAAEDQQAQAQLALALQNSTGASKAQIAQTEAWITKTSKAAAVADDELRPALATLVRATGDVGESQKAMGIALDVSAATGQDVETVSKALAKAYGGQTAGLKKLVPGIDAAVLASGDMTAIQEELARTTGGAAAKAAGTAAGQWKGFQIQLGEAQESIGGALLPVMTKLGASLQGVAVWVQNNTTLFIAIAGVIGVVASAVLVLNVAFKAYTIVTQSIIAITRVWQAAQLALNASFLANPVFLIIAGIVALVAVIVLIATKTTWFQDIWETVWGAIQRAAAAVWSWLQDVAKDTFQIIATLVKAYIGIYIAAWNLLTSAVSAVWEWIRNAVSTVLGVIGDIIRGYISIYVAIFQGIQAAVGAVWDALKNSASNALNAILVPIRAVQTAFDRVVDAIQDVINWLGRIKIPDALSKAGSIISGIFGRSAPASASVATAMSIAPATGARTFGLSAPTFSAASSNLGGTTIVVQGALDPVAVARQIRQILTTDQRRRAGVVIA